MLWSFPSSVATTSISSINWAMDTRSFCRSASLEAYLRQRAINQDTHPPQATPQQGAGAALNTNAASFECVEREHRYGEQVPHLVSQKPEVCHARSVPR